MTLGGNEHTTRGLKHSKKTKLLWSKSRKGKRPSKATRKKMSEDRKGEKNNFWGKQHSSKSKEKMSISHGGKPFWICDLQGNKIEQFVSQTECAQKYSLDNSSICSCLKKKLKSHYGYIFEYIEEQEKEK